MKLSKLPVIVFIPTTVVLAIFNAGIVQANDDTTDRITAMATCQAANLEQLAIAKKYKHIEPTTYTQLLTWGSEASILCTDSTQSTTAIAKAASWMVQNNASLNRRFNNIGRTIYK